MKKVYRLDRKSATQPVHYYNDAKGEYVVIRIRREGAGTWDYEWLHIPLNEVDSVTRRMREVAELVTSARVAR